MRQEIEVEIDETGEITLHVQGVKGKGCEKILDELTREIGGERGETRHTREWYAAEAKTGQRAGGKS